MSQPADAGDQIDLGPGDDTIVAGPGDTVITGTGNDEVALGDWSLGDDPVVVEDFDEQEDVITFAYASGTTEPEIEMTLNAQTGDAELRADGALFLIVRDAGPDFQIAQIDIRTYGRAA